MCLISISFSKTNTDAAQACFNMEVTISTPKLRPDKRIRVIANTLPVHHFFQIIRQLRGIFSVLFHTRMSTVTGKIKDQGMDSLPVSG